jgi:acetylornithine deacetylase
MERWVGERAAVTWGPMVPPVKLGALEGFATSIAAFATDIPELGAWGKPYLFGPGSIHFAHTAIDYIELDEARAAPSDYELLVIAAPAQLDAERRR